MATRLQFLFVLHWGRSGDSCSPASTIASDVTAKRRNFFYHSLAERRIGLRGRVCCNAITGHEQPTLAVEQFDGINVDIETLGNQVMSTKAVGLYVPQVDALEQLSTSDLEHGAAGWSVPAHACGPAIRSQTVRSLAERGLCRVGGQHGRKTARIPPAGRKALCEDSCDPCTRSTRCASSQYR
jgi:hypothetical protein